MNKPNNKQSIFEWFTDFKNLVLSILAIATGITTYFNLQIKQELDQQLNLAKLDREKVAVLSEQVAIDISQKKFSNEQFLLLNREVREALANADCDQHLLLAMLVDKMLAEELTLRDSIRNIIKNREPNCSATTYIQQEEQNEKAYVVLQEQQRIERADFRIDIFYLDDIPTESKPRARKIQELLINECPDYEIRLRLLPKTINARSGYRIGENQIRFDPDERELAKALRNLIVEERIFELEPPKLKLIQNNTDHYISLFIRNM